jgi:hypothetical protein
VLELVEEALDEVALAVEVFGHASLGLAVALGRDVGAGALASGEIDQGLGVVAAVRDEIACSAEARDQRDGGLLV